MRHTSYGALIRGYKITIPQFAVCAFEGVDEDDSLEYLKATYGANVTTVDELVGERAAVSA